MLRNNVVHVCTLTLTLNVHYNFRRVQSLQGDIYEMPERQQLRQLQVPTAVQGLPGMPHEQVRNLLKNTANTSYNPYLQLNTPHSLLSCVFQPADGQGASGETGLQGPDGSSAQPSRHRH